MRRPIAVGRPTDSGEVAAYLAAQQPEAVACRRRFAVVNDHAEAPNGLDPDTKKPGDWLTLTAKLLALLTAVAVLIVGILLLWDDLRGTPVAAGFTRVGGPTRVETAVDASRFWLTPPQCVVYAQAEASQKVMFRAARFAMAHDAPLLFTSRNPNRQQLVDRTVEKWQSEMTVPARSPERPWLLPAMLPPCVGKGYPAHANRQGELCGRQGELCGSVLERLIVSAPPNLSVSRLSTLAAANQLIPPSPALRVGARWLLSSFSRLPEGRGIHLTSPSASRSPRIWR